MKLIIWCPELARIKILFQLESCSWLFFIRCNFFRNAAIWSLPGRTINLRRRVEPARWRNDKHNVWNGKHLRHYENYKVTDFAKTRQWNTVPPPSSPPFFLLFLCRVFHSRVVELGQLGIRQLGVCASHEEIQLSSSCCLSPSLGPDITYMAHEHRVFSFSSVSEDCWSIPEPWPYGPILTHTW